tara:strand:- start:143 stop:265 length:123 start_codon:yes stop_codon:yes gene_type:complete
VVLDDFAISIALSSVASKMSLDKINDPNEENKLFEGLHRD